MKFNGVSLFANHTTDTATGENTNTPAVFGAQDQGAEQDNTIVIFTSAEGQSGSKVSLHKSLLLSALTLGLDKSIEKAHADGVTANLDPNRTLVTFASEAIDGTINLDDISVGVISQALENISFLRAQNGGVHSRLAFNSESLVAQKTNMRAALGRMVDVDMAEESTNLAKYSFLSQASASILSQANNNTELALMLLR